ncbi:hypothetical protein JTB14_009806 [Gonioctena quinquepunctata]|nr:hypothetical protein JTB14_009806 [Gonioctena quinquepunctata]
MIQMLRIYSIILLHLLYSYVHSCSDHFWVDYDGKIPEYAVLAGNNNDSKLYIGQAYIQNYGLMVGTLTPGVAEIKVAGFEVHSTDIMIKLLCAPQPRDYVWLPTTSSSFKADVEGELSIKGGYNGKKKNGTSGILNIGRTTKHGPAIVGVIAAYYENDVIFSYHHNKTRHSAEKYEVLVYRFSPIF